MSIDQQKNEIAEIIKRVPTDSARQRLTAELNILAGRHDAPTATAAEKAEVVARLSQLRRDAEIAAQVSLWSAFSMILAGGITAAYFVGIVLYLKGLGAPAYAGVEATRAVLVFTLIAAMLAFGGLLIIRPLFSAEEPAKLQERFRLSREIFMVFAGVFGTIIGFYFGTSTPAPADPPTLGVPSFAAGKVTVDVTGGRAPFRGTITLPSPGGNQRMEVSDHTLSYTIATCPAGATIEVRDRDDRRAEADPLSCREDGAGDDATDANDSSTANEVNNQ